MKHGESGIRPSWRFCKASLYRGFMRAAFTMWVTRRFQRPMPLSCLWYSGISPDFAFDSHPTSEIRLACQLSLAQLEERKTVTVQRAIVILRPAVRSREGRLFFYTL